MNLKIGGSNVGKIMYNGQEFGGATKLEPGTILYVMVGKESIEHAHLFSTTKKWENINGISIGGVMGSNKLLYGANISSDDFKNLDTKKKYTIDITELTVSRSIVDGEYRLNVSGLYPNDMLVIKAI